LVKSGYGTSPSTLVTRLAQVQGVQLNTTQQNIVRGGARMDHDTIDREQIFPIAHDTFQHVATVLIGQNTLLRTGIGYILSGSRFILAEDVLCDTSNVSAFAGELPVLFLIYESCSSDAYVELIEQVKAQCPTARVVILVDHIEPQAVMQVCEAGINGLCLTAMCGTSLIKALELVMLGEIFIPGALGFTLIHQTLSSTQRANGYVASPPAKDLFHGSKLSAREAQILHCLIQGASNKLIARNLELAEATVKVHIKAILRKVKVANRTQAAMWAQQHLNSAANDEIIAVAE
jgi:two-component system, NarL family, nitrate/nitrite response regulator NarL